MSKRRLIFRRLIPFTLLVVGLIGGLWAWWSYHGPAAEQEIYRGIYYGCERLPDAPDTGGLVHWVRADLNAPGVSLYVTPMNPDAQLHHYEYKLRHVSTAVREDHLAAAVNGTLFSSDSKFIRLPGDYAQAIETAVADHVVNHVCPFTFLLWWDDQNIAYLQTTKPPSEQTLKSARWAIGGQVPYMTPDYLAAEVSVDQRTFIAADPLKKWVWIVCFDKASYRSAAPVLQKLGAKIAIAVDGGTSTAMAIGSGAKNVRPGTITGNWRPVATQFGFRAESLP